MVGRTRWPGGAARRLPPRFELSSGAESVIWLVSGCGAGCPCDHPGRRSPRCTGLVTCGDNGLHDDQGALVLTRLEVDGFKNLLGLAIDFGAFTCIAGE